MFRIAQDGHGNYYVQQEFRNGDQRGYGITWVDVTNPIETLDEAKKTLQNWIESEEDLRLKTLRIPID